MPSNNPRYAKDPKKRNELRKKFKAQELPCGLCHKPIDYALTTYIDPKDNKRKPHPMRYELDEIVPVALGGDPLDPNNLQPAHRICNQRKGAKLMKKVKNAENERKSIKNEPLPLSRNW